MKMIEDTKSPQITVILKAHSENISLFGLYFLLIFAVVIFTIPVVFFIYLLFSNESVSFGFIVTCIISALVSFYLFRLFLWNKYGKEVYLISGNKFTYYYDYRLYKDNFNEIFYKSISICIKKNGVLMDISYMQEDGNNVIANENYYVYFLVDEQTIRTENKLPFNEIILIQEQIYYM